jgi:NADH-quinone oxidoreductase subunit J
VNRDLILAVFVVVLGASGVFLMLPHKHGATKPRNVHAAGAGLAGVSLLLFALYWVPMGPWVSGLFFYACAAGAVACGALTVTARDPVHSALWFAAVVLSTAGLFLLAGASFLAAGTVIVYAGAIIVTFLFVIMLAQMEGRAAYDRAARMPFRATWTCFVLFLGVVWTVTSAPRTRNPMVVVPGETGSVPAEFDARMARTYQLALASDSAGRAGVGDVLDHAVRPTARLDEDGRPKPHVAGLGETLYTDHLVVVELGGALLFVALVGALVIAAPKPPARPAGPTAAKV